MVWYRDNFWDDINGKDSRFKIFIDQTGKTLKRSTHRRQLMSKIGIGVRTILTYLYRRAFGKYISFIRAYQHNNQHGMNIYVKIEGPGRRTDIREILQAIRSDERRHIPIASTHGLNAPQTQTLR